MPKEIPILYSTAMIQAKLAGRKTQTRRTSKLDLINQNPDDWEYVFDDGKHMFFSKTQEDLMHIVKCPYGMPGDLLWARETWNQVFVTTSNKFPEGHLEFRYKADHKGMIIKGHDKYKPSIHMPKVAARIWDRVVSIRVERLQDINEEDVIAEGIEVRESGYRNYRLKEDAFLFMTAKRSYQTLWESINGLESWEANPWVWVVTTENVSLTGKPDTA
jgi:hypothetical protein